MNWIMVGSRLGGGSEESEGERVTERLLRCSVAWSLGRFVVALRCVALPRRPVALSSCRYLSLVVEPRGECIKYHEAVAVVVTMEGTTGREC